MKTIDLGGGLYAEIDDEDFAEISSYRWGVLRTPRTIYAQRRGPDGTVLMHRQIMAAVAGERIDHRDRNGLHNQRHNLRHATHQQNMQNKSKKVNASCEYKGVYVHKDRGAKPYRAQITADGVKIRIGLFADPVAAARAYDAEAIRLHGDFAATNVGLGLLPPL